MVTVKRVGVASAFKVGAIVSMLVWAVFGVCFLLLQATTSAAIITGSGSSFRSTSTSLGAIGGLLGGIMLYVCGVAIYAVIGGIGGALYALLYNFVAKTFGGLQIELTPIEGAPDFPVEKIKRTPLVSDQGDGQVGF